MIVVMLVIAMALGVTAVVSVMVAVHAKRQLGAKAQVPGIPDPKPAPEFPTLNERWIMEMEHELHPDQKFDHRGCRVCGPGPLKRYEVPSLYDHVYYKNVRLSDGYGGTWDENRKVSGPGEAQVVSSQIEGSDYHTIMLDIDLPARLVESSTPGHYHLYIDKPMTWARYNDILRALRKAGVIEHGFYAVAARRRETQLRPPWVEKER